MKKLLLIALLIVGCDNSTEPNGCSDDDGDNCDFDATIDDYIGTWVGIAVFTAELEDDSGSREATLILKLSGENRLYGTVDNGYEINNLLGSVSGSIFTFIFMYAETQMLNNAPLDNPDCINIVSGSVSLESQTKMNLEYSGTFCGSGGSLQASYSGTLTKQS